jgi:hypothetical protein
MKVRMNKPGKLLLLAAHQGRTRDSEVLALCERVERHLANRVANTQPVANTCG